MRLMCAFRLKPKCEEKASLARRLQTEEVAAPSPQLFTVMTRLTMLVIKLNAVLTRYNTVFKRLSAPAL